MHSVTGVLAGAAESFDRKGVLRHHRPIPPFPRKIVCGTECRYSILWTKMCCRRQGLTSRMSQVGVCSVAWTGLA
eukprot:43251-Chlamydomonas_euryale.AAC.4